MTRPARRSLAAVLAVLALALPTALAGAATAASPSPGTPVATGPVAKKPVAKKPVVKVRPSFAMTANVFENLRGKTIPSNFVGLSFEASQLDSPEIEPASGNLGRLLKSMAPGVVRFGGDSVENEWYADGFTTPPSWAVVQITDQDFQNLEDLLTVTGWKVELTVEAVHNDPVNAAAFVAAAQSHLGSNLIGVEVGNESDVYIQQYADYLTLFNNYKAAINAVAPGLPIIGPNTGNPQWLAQYATIASATSPVTEHLYALSRCNGTVPTIAQLLSPATQAQETTFLYNGLAPAQANGVPLRIDESNSVACSGQDGVSNVLASSVWGVDYMLRLAVNGVAGLNLHAGLGNCHGYTPLCQELPGDHDQNIERARPLWYAMLLVHSLEGSTFLPEQSVNVGGHNVPVYALISPNGTIRVVIDDMDTAAKSPDAKVLVKVPKALRSASVERLTGPALDAKDYISLGGAEVAKNGTWKPTSKEKALGDHGNFTVVVPAGSVAMLTFSTKPVPVPKPVVKKPVVKQPVVKQPVASKPTSSTPAASTQR